MKTSERITIGVAICVAVLSTVFAVSTASTLSEETKAHHDYTRRVELQLADMKARIEILENIGVEIHVSTHGDAVALTATEVEQ